MTNETDNSIVGQIMQNQQGGQVQGGPTPQPVATSQPPTVGQVLQEGGYPVPQQPAPVMAVPVSPPLQPVPVLNPNAQNMPAQPPGMLPMQETPLDEFKQAIEKTVLKINTVEMAGFLAEFYAFQQVNSAVCAKLQGNQLSDEGSRMQLFAIYRKDKRTPKHGGSGGSGGGQDGQGGGMRDPDGPPTEKQMNFLRQLQKQGFLSQYLDKPVGNYTWTKQQASTVIDQGTVIRDAKQGQGQK